jgi:transglutaminase-like putative cysteine protease
VTVLCVKHRTQYLYQHPVVLGPHRLMCRPRDSHDLRLLDTGIAITPQPSELRWMHDVFGNSIAIATFSEPAAELVFESTFRAEHFPLPERTLLIDDYALTLPLSYCASEDVDLGSSKARHYPDPEHKLDAWVKSLPDATPGHGTLDVLMAMIAAIKSEFTYKRREEVGVQSPVETLDLKAGSCRDFAVFMMDAVRFLGLAAQAAPLIGSFTGTADDFLALHVTVEVTAE